MYHCNEPRLWCGFTLKKLIDQFYPNVAVVSFSEIDNNIQIQALGNISLSQR